MSDGIDRTGYGDVPGAAFTGPVRLDWFEASHQPHLGVYGIGLVFSNNRYQGVVFSKGDLASTVARELRELADQIDRNAKTNTNTG